VTTGPGRRGERARFASVPGSAVAGACVYRKKRATPAGRGGSSRIDKSQHFLQRAACARVMREEREDEVAARTHAARHALQRDRAHTRRASRASRERAAVSDAKTRSRRAARRRAGRTAHRTAAVSYA
jgi:hypothetical protein